MRQSYKGTLGTEKQHGACTDFIQGAGLRAVKTTAYLVPQGHSTFPPAVVAGSTRYGLAMLKSTVSLVFPIPAERLCSWEGTGTIPLCEQML